MKTLGKYIILGELGQGGMGMVYKARDPRIGRDVAIKMIHERALNVPEVRDRFYREAKSAGKLSHENIMIIHDIGEEEGEPYIVMELLTGTDLRTVMRSAQPLTLEQKLDIALQISHGLQYAHQHNVVHRDIKPENVRVLASGRVKIMDFGIARLGSESQTLTNSSIGSPRYMSPEQVRGRKVDHRSDIFSFGVLFYELLTGIKPFSGDHVTTVIYKIIHEEPDPIQLNDPHLTAELQAIVSHCLEKDVEQRYQNFAEIIDDLNALLAEWRADQTVPQTRSISRTVKTRSAPPPSKTAPGIPWARLAVGAVVLVGLLGGGYFFWPRTEGGPAESETSLTSLPEADAPAAEPAPSVPDDTIDLDATDPTEPSPAVDEPAVPESAPLPDATSADAAAEADLQQARAAADQQRSRMQTQRQQADAADAATLVAPLYSQAQRLETDGLAAWQEETRTGYESAQRTFAEAARGYAAAAEAARQRRDADDAQQAMEAVRQQALPARDDASLADAFAEADALRDAGLDHLANDRYTESTEAFRAAQGQYADLRRQLAEVAQAAATATAQEQTEAARARSAMRTAKNTLGPDLRERSSYQRALQLERQGEQAFADETFDEAAALFTQAQTLFDEVATTARAEAQARQTILDLISQFERSFEQEDLEALQQLHTFYASWAPFFDVAQDVEATVSNNNLDVRGTTASVQVHVRFEYLDNKSRRQSGEFVHAWALQQTNPSTWAVAQVTAQ